MDLQKWYTYFSDTKQIICYTRTEKMLAKNFRCRFNLLTAEKEISFIKSESLSFVHLDKPVLKSVQSWLKDRYSIKINLFTPNLYQRTELGKKRGRNSKSKASIQIVLNTKIFEAVYCKKNWTPSDTFIYNFIFLVWNKKGQLLKYRFEYTNGKNFVDLICDYLYETKGPLKIRFIS